VASPSARRDDAYGEAWRKSGPLVVRLVDKYGRCAHEVGDEFVYETPYDAPPQLCHALAHVLDLYLWRVALGFPSWEADDSRIYRVHCPSKRGTVWELRKAEVEPAVTIEVSKRAVGHRDTKPGRGSAGETGGSKPGKRQGLHVDE